MPRWIAFDETTLKQLRRQFPREPVFEHGARDIIDYAATGPETLVTVLPLDRGEAAVAVFRHGAARSKIALPFERVRAESKPVAPTPLTRSTEKSPVAPKDKDKDRRDQQSPRLRAGGMLGLNDETVFEEEPRPQKKKTWWQRWWADDE
ncbi:MAG TPA: hypothetical protein VF532_05725 [Candidatus Angelobacter sp.]